MVIIDQTPPVVCVIVREQVGDRIQMRGRVLSPRLGQGTYSLHIVKTGPAGTSNVQMGGHLALAANIDTFVGIADFNADPNASYTTDFTVTVDERVYPCALANGGSK